MENIKIQWVLRLAVFGEFFGHGVFALQGKKQWIEWTQELLNINPELATKIMLAVGILDILIALVVLFKPIRAVLLWATVWGFWTALLRPIVGEPVWDFVERWANWGAPLALLLILGWPTKKKDWLQ